MAKWHPRAAQREHRPQEHRQAPSGDHIPCMSNGGAHGIDPVLKAELYQHSDTLPKWFRNPFKLGSMISILTKACFLPLPIPTQPEAMVAQSTSSFGRALKVHTLSQICWFRCCIPQGRQNIDVEPKNRKTEKQNKNSWIRQLLLHSKPPQYMALSPQAQGNKNLSNKRHRIEKNQPALTRECLNKADVPWA